MFEDKIAQVISERGIKITHLSTVTGISYPVLRQSLHGRRQLRANELAVLCKALSLSMDELYEMAEEKEAVDA